MNIFSWGIIGCLGLLGSPLVQAISGYDRLYNHYNGTTIDILYDDHVPQDRLSAHSMRRATLRFVEQHIHAEEARFMKILRVLNTRPVGTVALIWEQGIHTDADTEFIGYSSRLIRDQFKRIRYIASDFSRDAFETLVYSSLRQGKRVGCSVRGCTLSNPLPVSKKQKESILHYSGVKAWYEYRKFYAHTLGTLKSHFAGRKYCTEADFTKNDAFDALTDCEMITHLLCAPESHIILFAGGWHSQNISNFLQKRLHCKLLYSFQPYERIVPLKSLDRIMFPYVPSNDKRPLKLACAPLKKKISVKSVSLKEVGNKVSGKVLGHQVSS